MAGDFRSFQPTVRKIRTLETGYQIAKGRHWRAFLQSVKVRPGTPAPPGWRRSVDRTCLRADSLLTGNFTGNFAILGLPEPISASEISVLQPLIEEFPTQVNREHISRNREFICENREFTVLLMRD